MSKIITMIPVRMASTRLPNKPLLDINGKTLIQRVYEHVKAAVPGDIVIAAGDQIIVDEAKKFGAQAVLTDSSLPSGTDRIAAALKKIDPNGTQYDIVVNFQGDGINVDPKVNLGLIEMIQRTDCDIATCGMMLDGWNTSPWNMAKRDKPPTQSRAMAIRLLAITAALLSTKWCNSTVPSTINSANRPINIYGEGSSSAATISAT